MLLSFGICTKTNSPTNASRDLFRNHAHEQYTSGFLFYETLIVFIPLYLLTCTFFSAALCLDPPAIVNGMSTFTGNSVGDTATYSCNTGFELIGDLTTMCTQIDATSAAFPAVPPPECRREYFMAWNFCTHLQLWRVYKKQITYKCLQHDLINML